ncbi:MAG: methylmalonyl-CoA mutase, partial [Dehalococcoidia bacterium]|nr:methylmalonyl-CoA mutase [Dehalococcoidia bacterium]
EISCFDEPIRTPSPEAAVVALRTQQIIAYESSVTKVVDPLGGSYFVEALTNELEMRILGMVKEIELQGSAPELSEKGYFHAIFENASKRYQQAVSTGRKKIVKVNTLCMPSEEDALLKESVETRVEVSQEQIEKIKELKAQRNKTDVKQALNEVYERARNRSANLIPVIMEALDKDLTMGEIAVAIRLSYGVAFDHFEMVERPS